MNARGTAPAQWHQPATTRGALRAPAGARDAIVAEEGADIHDREGLLEWLGSPWADVLISAAGLEWLETPAERLNFLEAGLEELGPPWCNGCTAGL